MSNKKRDYLNLNSYLRIKEILLLASRLLLSTTFMYRCVVVILLCAMLL